MPIEKPGEDQSNRQSKAVDEALSLSLDHVLASIVESSDDAIIGKMLDGRIVTWNCGAERLYGYSAEEVQARSISILVPPEQPDELPAILDRLRRGERFEHYETVRVCKDGRRVDVSVTVSPIKGADGRIVGASTIARDITERKRADERLRESEERYRSLAEAIPLLIWETDSSLNVVYLNRQMREYAGRSSITGEERRRLVHPEDLPHVLERWREAMRTDGVFQCEQRLRRHDGEYRWFLGRSVPVRDSAGSNLGSIDTFTDIHDLKQTQAERESLLDRVQAQNEELQAQSEEIQSQTEELQAQNEELQRANQDLIHAEEELSKLSQAVEQSGSTVVITDTRGDIEYVNPQFTRTTGYTREEAIGINPRILKSGETPPEEYKRLWDTLLSGREWRGEFHNKKRNGELYWEAATISPVRNSAGVITHLMAVKEDITERKWAEEERQKLNEDLERRVAQRTYELQTANLQLVDEIAERRRAEEELKQARDTLEQRVKERTVELERSNADLQQFAYIASHDLQEPLRMVASYVGLLAQSYKGRLDADADEFIEYAVDGANRMQSLINDLLAYSRVGTRGQPMVLTDCASSLDQALANLQLTIAGTGAEVTHDPLPTVKADAIQLVQLFQNFIGNAIKFRGAEPPRVHVSAGREGHEWVFSVRDNGIGIDPEYFDRIFVIFQRLHSKAKYAGTGIGLAICKKIVERHGGRIWVESEPGHGCTFYFTLPISGEEQG